MPFPATGAVDPLRIAHVQRLEHLLQAIFGFRHRDQVDVVAHQAVGEHLDLVFLGVVLQPAQIGLAIVVCKEHLLAPIAPLGDVVGDAGTDGAGKAGHGGGESSMRRGWDKG